MSVDITLFTASYNTRAATELAVRSAHRFADRPFDLIVGDSASRDGSREMLQKLEARGLLQLVSMDEPRKHGEWLNWFIANCPSSIGVIFDSDIEFMKDGWLGDLVEALTDNDAAFVGGESSPLELIHNTPDHGTVHGMPRPALPWLMAVDINKVRPLRASFCYVLDGRDENGYPYAYDVGGFPQKRAADLGYPVMGMPNDYLAKFRHFRGLSWRKELGVRVLRHYIKMGRIYGRLTLRRIDDRLARI